MKWFLLFLALAGFSSSAAAQTGPPTQYGRKNELAVFRIDVPRALTAGASPIRLQARPVGKAAFAVCLTFVPVETSNPPQFDAKILGRFRPNTSGDVALVRLGPPGTPAETLATFHLSPPAKPPENAELVREWAGLRAATLAYRNGNSFTAYEIADTLRRGDVTDDGAVRLGRRGGRDLDLYSVTTGGAAIRESLQTDRLPLVDGTATGKRVPVATLAGPKVASHPFATMLKGRAPVVPEIARFLPADQYALEFSTLRAQFDLSDLLDQWGTSLLHSIEITSRDRKVKERILGQLGIEATSLARSLGDLAVGELAITGNDPYVTDGNDVTVVFNVKNAALFDTALTLQRANVKKDRPDATESSEVHGGVTIDALTTPDRAVSSYRAAVGNFRIYSNSPVAIRRVLDAADGKRPALRDAAEYRYMRSIFPATAEAEDAFLYLSDAFIRRVVGAEQKIGRLRQVQTIAYLNDLEAAVQLRRIEKGDDAPVTVEMLVAEKRIESPAVACPYGGAVTLSADGTARSAVFGTTRLVTPLVEIPVKDANVAEAAGYRQFVEGYSQYWRTYFDPVGIRFRVKDEVTVETCILPLIENSLYTGVRDLAGGDPVVIPLGGTDRTIASFGMKLAPRSRVISDFLRELSPNRAANERLIAALGKGVAINVCDGVPLFTVGRNLAGFILGTGFGESDFFIGTLVSALTLPMYVTIEVTDPAAATAAIDDMLTGVAFSEVMRRGDLTVESYALEPYRGVAARTVGIDFFLKFRLHVAVVGNRLHIATQRDTLEHLIDVHLDGKTSAATTPANLALTIRPEAFDRLQPTVATIWQERMRQACAANFSPVETLLDEIGVPADRLDAESLKRFGYVPFCPEGGRYTLENGEAACSVHGSARSPRQPRAANGDLPFMRFVESIRRTEVEFQFIPEGVRTTVRLRRRPSQP